jgi:hypothetical protein
LPSGEATTKPWCAAPRAPMTGRSPKELHTHLPKDQFTGIELIALKRKGLARRGVRPTLFFGPAPPAYIWPRHPS